MGRRRRERGWPEDPEPLPVPVPDNHTHLESIGALAPRATGPAATTEPAATIGPAAATGPAAVTGPATTEPSGAEGVSGGWTSGEGERRRWPGFGPGEVPTPREHLDRARAAGIDRIIQVGCDLPSARWTGDLLRELTGDPRYSRAALGAVAIHPNEAVLHAGVAEVGPDGLEPRFSPWHRTTLDDAVAEIADLARANERIRAIGETGMDLFRTGPRGAEVQREAFRAHIALAKELDLALQIHDRDAHAEVLDVLARDGAPRRTVFHCYSGDAQMARYCADQGWYLSFAGPVTFPSNTELRTALATVPLDRVMVETDAPYLTPHPFRGQPDAPYVAAHTVRAVAHILGRDLTDVCQYVARTAEEVYGPW